MNDHSLGTTSMMSTTSQFSSPIESTEISDWSKAERLTFVPPNGLSSPESFRVNLTKVPPPSAPRHMASPHDQSQWAQNGPVKQKGNLGNWIQRASSSSSVREQLSSHQQHYQLQQQPQHYYQKQLFVQPYQQQVQPQQQHQIQVNTQQIYQQQSAQQPYKPQPQQPQKVPSQSEWMQNILSQNQNAAADNNKPCGIEGMRSLWEERIIEDRRQRQYDQITKSRHFLNEPRQFLFPKWRSVDPMTASLVASSRTAEIIPRDSRIPEHRQERLVETERAAHMDKFELHKPYIQMAICRQNQRRGRSLLMCRPTCDTEEMARRRTMALYDESTGQWYDPNQIRQAVSYESIANVGSTRQMWEQNSWQAEVQNQWEREQERNAHFAQQNYWK